MKILVINGSPKRDRSDTMHLTRAFVDGMNEVQQNEVTQINVIERNIKYCTGCFTCMRNGGECIHHDDMPQILHEITHSDLQIISFPLYCYGMPAPLKAMMDRMVSLVSLKMEANDDHYQHPAQADLSRQRYVMISGCGFPNSEHNFEGAVKQFQLMFGDGATIITVPEAPLFNIPIADPVTKPFLQIMRKAGHEFAENGVISDETMQRLAIPMIPEEEYASTHNASL